MIAFACKIIGERFCCCCCFFLSFFFGQAVLTMNRATSILCKNLIWHSTRSENSHRCMLLVFSWIIYFSTIVLCCFMFCFFFLFLYYNIYLWSNFTIQYWDIREDTKYQITHQMSLKNIDIRETSATFALFFTSIKPQKPQNVKDMKTMRQQKPGSFAKHIDGISINHLIMRFLLLLLLLPLQHNTHVPYY